MTAKTPTEKLTVLLPHWLEHNEEHIAEMRTYLQAIELQGETETSRRFGLAITRMGQVSDALLTVIATLDTTTTPR